MNFRNKKALLLTGLFLAVLAAGYANYAITAAKKGGQQEEQQKVQQENAFSVFKEERETTRMQELKYIESVVESAETDDQTKANAQAQKLTLAANMENELLTEGLIQTGLGMEAVVTISSEAVNVVVDKEELSETEVTQIADIIKSHTQAEAESIKIMPKA